MGTIGICCRWLACWTTLFVLYQRTLVCHGWWCSRAFKVQSYCRWRQRHSVVVRESDDWIRQRRHCRFFSADYHTKDQTPRATATVVASNTSNVVAERKQQQPAGWNFAVGCATLAGTDPDRPQKVNQDGYFVLQGSTSKPQLNDDHKSDNVRVICAMDGHGRKGHVVVQYLQRQLARIVSHRLGLYATTTTDNISNGHDDSTESDSETLWDDDSPDRINRQIQDLTTWGHWNRTEEERDDGNNSESNAVVVGKALMDSFLAAQRSAQDNPSIPSGRSGTTCILATVLATTNDTTLDVYTATVGDSHAIAIAIPASPRDAQLHDSCRTLDNNAAWTVQALSTPTTVPHMASERARIQASDGAARMDDSGNVWYGPIGIAMTRSLGNSVMLRAGILPVPIVSRYTSPRLATTPQPCIGDGEQSLDLEPPLSYLVCVGTDGVFDVLSHERTAHGPWSANRARSTRRRWKCVGKPVWPGWPTCPWKPEWTMPRL
jgi:Protein phosphatase 2C